jgi:Cu-Zn family superoxide dismutase
VILAGCVLTGCASMGGGPSGPRAAADLVNAGGQKVGTAGLTQHGASVRLVVEVAGLTPGPHGIHLHAIGRCDPPAFTSAGGHHNPLRRRHGLETPQGPHAGDLPNLVADATGQARYETTTDRVTIDDGPLGLFDADGTAIVVHERADDHKTDPAGDSGARVACGVLVRR